MVLVADWRTNDSCGGLENRRFLWRVGGRWQGECLENSSQIPVPVLTVPAVVCDPALCSTMVHVLRRRLQSYCVLPVVFTWDSVCGTGCG